MPELRRQYFPFSYILIFFMELEDIIIEAKQRENLILKHVVSAGNDRSVEQLCF